MPSSLRHLPAPLLLLSLLFAAAPLAHAQSYPEWGEAFEVYKTDPAAGAELLIELGRRGTDNLPPSVLTVLGDAYLRQGNYGTARKMFLRALEDPSAAASMGPFKAPIASHAELGLAAAAIGAGKLADAREWFAKASAAGGDLGHLATLGHAQAAIALGRHDEGLEILEALNDTEGVEPSLVEASQFATANALLDAGDYEAAAAAFQQLSDEAAGDLALDAAFAAAMARYRGGDRGEALASLSALVERCPEAGEDDQPRKVTRAERELDPTAVLQSWVRNYREQSFSDYGGGPGPAFSLHGCDLAVETVAVLEEVSSAVVAAEPVPAEPEAAPAGPAAGRAGTAAVVPARSEADQSTARDAEAGGGFPGWIAALVVVGVLVAGWFWRRG